MRCNICGGSEFLDMNVRKGVRCSQCGSLERTRLLWLYLEKLEINEKTRILHLAPEKGMYERLSALCGPNYVTADMHPRGFPFAKDMRGIDLCDLEDWPAEDFDIILHAHVLEHVQCNFAYTLFHLHRMLKPDGVHLCVIPFLSGRYDETYQDIGDAERDRRFGQFDHVRRFGVDDIPMHLGKVVRVPDEFDATKEFGEEVLLAANIPPSHWTGFHIGTVLRLKKRDYLL